MKTITVWTGCLLGWMALDVGAREDLRGSDDAMEFAVSVGRYEGKYGLEESTTLDMLSTSLRWYLPSGAFSVTVPYALLEGPADVRLIGGAPVPGFSPIRIGLPVDPPIVPGPADGEETVIEPRRESGLSDITLRGEYHLLQGNETRPWVTGLLRVTLPTGDDERGLGTGDADVEAGLGIAQPIGAVSLLADAGYTWIGGADSAELQNVVRLGLGVAALFGPERRHEISVYGENRSNARRGLEDQRWLSLTLGTRAGQQRRLLLSGSINAGLSDTTEDYGVFARLGYLF